MTPPVQDFGSESFAKVVIVKERNHAVGISIKFVAVQYSARFILRKPRPCDGGHTLVVDNGVFNGLAQWEIEEGIEVMLFLIPRNRIDVPLQNLPYQKNHNG